MLREGMSPEGQEELDSLLEEEQARPAEPATGMDRLAQIIDFAAIADGDVG